MDKKQVLKNITLLLKEMDETRLRLESAKPDYADIELALLERQTLQLYQYLQEYKKTSSDTVKEMAPAPPPGIEARRERLQKLMQMEEGRGKAEEGRGKMEEKKTAAEPAKPSISEVYAKAREKASLSPKPSETTTSTREPEVVATSYTPPASKPTAAAAEKPLHEKLQKPQESLNERLAQQDTGIKKTLSDKLKLSPINDLKSAINLNQKIAFIKELFGGDEKEYKKALQFINGSKNFSEAKYYLQSQAGKQNGWKEEDPLVGEFMELVYRKFL